MAKKITHPPPVALIGRDDLMAWMERTVLPENHEERKNQCPFVLLYGAQGIGKSSACRQFVQTQLGQSPNVQPLFAFDWKGGVQGRSVLRFSRLLFEMGSTNLSLGGAHQNLLLVDVKSASEAAFGVGDLSHPDQTYREDGVAEDVLQTPQGLSDSEQTALAQEFVDQLISWIGGALQDPAIHLLGKVVFIFDDFEDYHVSIRQWVGRYMYPTLKSAEGLPGCAYLFTGRRSWDHCGFADHWELTPGSLKQYQLNPLTPSDCKQWLNAAGLKEEYLETLIEETEGIPGQIKALLDQPGALEALSRGGGNGGPLSRFSPKERRWLHAASMSPSVTLEAFELLVGRIEAIDALHWLRRHPELCTVRRATGSEETIQVDQQIRSLVLQMAKSKIPIRHEEYTSRLDLVRQLSAKVPVQQHRRYLQMLSPVEPLSEEAIRYVYGED